MLTEAKNNLKLVGLSFKYNLLKAMDNRVAFISQVLGMILNDGLMIIQWIVLFSIQSNIGGYGFKEILLLWGLAAGTFGIAHMFFSQAFNISNLIIDGKLDAFLVQPKDPLLYIVTSGMSVSAVGDLLYGIVVLLIVHPPIVTSLLYLFFTVIGGIIVVSFSIILNSLTLYFKNSTDLANTLNMAVVNFGTYPDGIFDGIAKVLLLTIIPVGWAVYIPLSVIVEFNLGLFCSVILFTIFMVVLANILFKNGLKRYSSSNLMSARI